MATATVVATETLSAQRILRELKPGCAGSEESSGCRVPDPRRKASRRRSCLRGCETAVMMSGCQRAAPDATLGRA